jgi:hypothetical protein
MNDTNNGSLSEKEALEQDVAKRRDSANAAGFLTWLIEDINTVTAEVDSPRDMQLRSFEKLGFLRVTGLFHGTREYEITTKGAVEGLDLSFKEEIELGRFVDVDPSVVLKAVRADTIAECAAVADAEASLWPDNIGSSARVAAAKIRRLDEDDTELASCNHWPGQRRCGVCGTG